jgi:hypothetical protein
MSTETIPMARRMSLKEGISKGRLSVMTGEHGMAGTRAVMAGSVKRRVTVGTSVSKKLIFSGEVGVDG